MADDPKSGTGEGAGGAAGNPASGTPPASGGEAEKPEQVIARLQAERDAAIKAAEDEKALRLSQLNKVEEANRVLRGSGGTPPTPTADPLTRDIEDLGEYLKQVMAAGQRDVVAEIKYRELAAERESRSRDMAFEQAIQRAEPVFAVIGDEALRNRARELFSSGNFRSADLAVAAAKGERYDQSETERKRLESLASERQKELERRAAGAPGIPPSSGGMPERRTRMKFSEYVEAARRDPSGEGRRLREQRDKGELVLDMSG